MWLALSIILLSSLRASADFANPAPGIITWCNYSEPSYVPSDLTRITRGTRGAWACLGPYGNYPQQQNLDYTGCPTADSWGSDVRQCAVPGYYPMGSLAAPTNRTVQPGFPATFDQRDACNQNVYTAPLVDSLGNEYGSVDIFKDYDDNLYVTSTLWSLTNFTPHGQTARATSPHDFNTAPVIGCIWVTKFNSHK
eukprot:gene10824-16910_t